MRQERDRQHVAWREARRQRDEALAELERVTSPDVEYVPADWLELHRELAWAVVNLRTSNNAGAAGHMYDLAARLHNPDWRPAWDRDGSGDINSAEELQDYASGITAWEDSEE